MIPAEELVASIHLQATSPLGTSSTLIAAGMEALLNRIKALEKTPPDSWEASIRALVRKWQAEVDLADSYSEPSSYSAQGRKDQLKICIDELRTLLK